MEPRYKPRGGAIGVGGGGGSGGNDQRAKVPHKNTRWTNVVPYGPEDTYASCGMVGSTSGSSLVKVTVTTTVITTSTRPHMRQTRCGRGAQDDNVTKLDQIDSPTMPHDAHVSPRPSEHLSSSRHAVRSVFSSPSLSTATTRTPFASVVAPMTVVVTVTVTKLDPDVLPNLPHDAYVSPRP